MVFKIISHRLRNNLFILFVTLSMVFLILVAPIALNLVEALRFRGATARENYRTDYSDGYGELNMELRLEELEEEVYYYYISYHLTSGSAVEIVGIKHLNSSVDVLGYVIKSDIYDWDPPFPGPYSYRTSVRLTKNDKITWSGSAEVQYISNSIIQNETYNYILTILVPMGSVDYFNLQIVSNFVFFGWILAFPVLPILLNYIIKPSFSVPLDEETKKKQKKYFDFFRKTKEEQS